MSMMKMILITSGRGSEGSGGREGGRGFSTRLLVDEENDGVEDIDEEKDEEKDDEKEGDEDEGRVMMTMMMRVKTADSCAGVMR